MARYYTFEKQFFVKQHFECLIASSIVSLSPHRHSSSSFSRWMVYTYGSLRSFLPTTTSHAYRLKLEYRILFFKSAILCFGKV